MQMSTLLSAEPRGAECLESRSIQAQEQKNDLSNGLKIWDNKNILDESLSFQIRGFVSTVRQRDFSRCWPFRQKILEKCVNAGLKPFLPPFEPLPKSCDNEEGEYGLLFSRSQQVSCPREDEGLHERSDSQDVSNCHKVPPGEEARSCVITTSIPDKETDGDGPSGLELVKLCAGQLVQEIENPASERSGDYFNNEFGTHAKATQNDTDPSDSGNEAGDFKNVKVIISLHGENVALSGVKDSDFHGSSQNECEAGSTIKPCISLYGENIGSSGVKGSDCHGSSHNEGEGGSALDAGLSVSVSKSFLLKNLQQYHKGKFKLLSSECPIIEEQAGVNNNKSKLSKVVTAGKLLQEGAQLSSERLTISENATEACVERDGVELPARLERHCRNGDDSSFNGLNLDMLVPQVCPVCLNFTSTSNTALNAHIDHCLESVLPGEKGESRASKHRIKPRKMRSMVDICATALTRTLEDLERSSKIWALNAEASKEEASCSPRWNNGLVRRQPRTSVHRGPGWKARNSLETDDTRQVCGLEMQPQIEKPYEEDLIAKQPEMREWTEKTAVAHEQSYEGQQQHHQETSGTMCAASPATLGRGTLAKKKQKRGSTNTIPIKEVLMSKECTYSNAEDEDQSWSLPFDLRGFTTIDTSVEEERRLVQKLKCANEGETEAGKIPKEGFLEDAGNKLSRIFKQQFLNGPALSDLTSKKCDNKPSNEVNKKRLRTSIESDWILSNSEISGEEDEVVLQSPFERPTKNKKGAPKIKSLLTVVANSCKERGKDEIEGPGSNQITNEVQERVVNTTANGGSSSCQDTRLKRRSLTSVQDTTEGFCELNKRARSCSEQPTSSEAIHLYSPSEQQKSPKQGSASLGRALIEQEEPYMDCPQQGMPRCSTEEFDDGNLPREASGCLTRLLSTHHPEKNNTYHASEKTNKTSVVASTTNILVDAAICPTDMSGMTEIRASFCRNRYEFLRKISTNAPKEACSNDGEGIFRKTAHGAEQSSKTHLSMSQRSTAVNSGSSANPFTTFSNLNSVETDFRHSPQLLPLSQRSFFSESVTCSRPIEHLRAKQPLYDSLAASNSSMPLGRDRESSHANTGPRWYNPPQSLASGRKPVKDNGQPLAAAEGSENVDQCMQRCSVKHAAPQVSFRASESCERSWLNQIDSPVYRDVHILDSRNNFVAKKTGLMETSQRAANFTASSEVPHRHKQVYLGSRFPSLDFSPGFLSAASETLPESVNNGSSASNGYDYATVSPPSSLLADIARTMVTDCRKSQAPLQRSTVPLAEQQQTLQASQQRTAKNLTEGHEYLNLLPSQGIGKSCAPSGNNRNEQPHVLQTAVQALKANTPNMINSECVNGLRGSVDVSRNVRGTLPSISTFRTDRSIACMNGTRETFPGAELGSNFGNFGSVEYPVEQGVVHIFGSPVFKLMGQNVIVTSNSIKALGSCDQSIIQRLQSPGSIRHLGVLPETQHHYAPNLSPELYSSSHLEAWHADASVPRSHSFMMESLEINPQAPQHVIPTTSVHSKLPAYKDPVMLKPQMPMRILDEESRSSRLSRELAIKKAAVVTPGSKIATESLTDTMPGGSGSLPSGLSRRGNGMIAQPNKRQFVPSSCTLPQHEQHSHAYTLQSTSATYFEDIQKLDGSGCGTRYRSGTLADIVQSSERGTS